MTYTIVVTNESRQDDLRLISLVDDRFGDLNGEGSCQLPQELAPGARYECAFTRFLPVAGYGVHLNRVTALAEAADPLPRTGTLRAQAQSQVSAQDWAAVLLIVPPGPLPGQDVPIPLDQTWALAILFVLLALLGLRALGRR